MAKLTSEDIQLLLLDEVKGGNKALLKVLSDAAKQPQSDPEIKRYITELSDKISNFVNAANKPLPIPQVTVNTDTKDIQRMFAEIRDNQAEIRKQSESINDNLLAMVSLLAEKPAKVKVTKRNFYSQLIDEAEIVYTSGNIKSIINK